MSMEDVTTYIEEQKTYRRLMLAVTSVALSLIGGITWCHRPLVPVVQTSRADTPLEYIIREADDRIEEAKAALDAAYQSKPGGARAEMVAKYATRLSDAYRDKENLHRGFSRDTNLNSKIIPAHNIIPARPSNKCECECCQKTQLTRSQTSGSL